MHYLSKGYRKLQSRRFRKRNPTYNRDYMKSWYDAHPGYHAAQMRESRKRKKVNSMPIGVYHRPGHTDITPALRAAIIADRQAGVLNIREIAEKYKISPSTVDRYSKEAKKKTQDLPTTPLPEAPPIIPNDPESPSALGVKKGYVKKYQHLLPQMIALRAEGHSFSEIARRIGMGHLPNPSGMVSSYLRREEKNSGSQSTEGVQTNGHEQLDTRFLVGFGCAELERTLTTIAQRLGIAPGLLRQGFSKLLGNTAFRS